MNEQGHTVEIAAPDIEPYREGNTGVPFVATLDSGTEGPHALICALMHGNEISGAVALDHLFRQGISPQRGRLTLMFANTAAYGLFDPAKPLASRYVDEDMNRLWSPEALDDANNSVERRRARQLRPFIDAADFVLDLHSMQTGRRPLHLSGPTDKGRVFARRVGGAATIVSDVGHADGTRMRDYGRFNTPGTIQNALLAECGPHWELQTAKTAVSTAYRFLSVLDLLSPDAVPEWLEDSPPAQTWIEITDRFVPETRQASFARRFDGLDIVADAGTVIAWDGDREIRTPYDDCVLVMPARRLLPGQTAVRLGRHRGFDIDAG
ncbi:MAG: succinylglutamate desuccinylase/aspartoacylase family protein [Alphaproteobacteria bacterium]|nr:succinylglutamate desuccinylase/aspartoacylase family protein [Alphaproteobacteria bacterium]